MFISTNIDLFFMLNKMPYVNVLILYTMTNLYLFSPFLNKKPELIYTDMIYNQLKLWRALQCLVVLKVQNMIILKFFISSHLKMYSPVELNVVLEKKPQKHVLVRDMTMRQLYALNYVRLQLLDKLFPNHWGYDIKMLKWSTFVAAIVMA